MATLVKYTSEESEIINKALAILESRHKPGKRICSPIDTRNYLRLRLTELKNEVFGAIFLDNQHRVLGMGELFFGTIDGASVHPRVVVQRALDVNAAAVVFYHNHPSGIAEPSRADVALTKRLSDALTLIDVRVIDHFIICDSDTVSFAERGTL